MALSPCPHAVNLLAFDTSTENLSVALAWGERNLLTHEGAGGAQASATLIPAVLRLLEQAGMEMAALDAIVFGRGPGSFTGLRTACSVAQGLAFGADVPVLPVDTLMAVAEEARHQSGATRVVAMLDARMDELYCAAYEFDGQVWQLEGGYALDKPEALQIRRGWALAGNVFTAYGERIASNGPRINALPTAQALLRIAPALIAAGQSLPAAQALPLYIRDKVAQTTQERAVIRALAGKT